MIQKSIITYAVNPGIEFIGAIESLGGQIGLDVRFLRNIIGKRSISTAKRHKKATESFLCALYMSYELLARHPATYLPLSPCE